MESIVGSLGIVISVAGAVPSNVRTSFVIGSLTRHDLLIASLVLAMLVCAVFVVLCIAYLKALNEAQSDPVQIGEFKKHEPMDIKLPKSMSSTSGSARIAPVIAIAPTRQKLSQRDVLDSQQSLAKSKQASSSDSSKERPNLRLIEPGHPTKDFNIVDKTSEISKYVRDNLADLNSARTRVNSLELLMGEKMHLANRELNYNLLSARRILRAVEGRLSALDHLLSWNDSEQTERAYVMMNSLITVPKDAVNALLSEDSIPPLDSFNWNETIDSLLMDAETQVKIAINQ